MILQLDVTSAKTSLRPHIGKGWLDKKVWREINDVLSLYGFLWDTNDGQGFWHYVGIDNSKYSEKSIMCFQCMWQVNYTDSN